MNSLSLMSDLGVFSNASAEEQTTVQRCDIPQHLRLGEFYPKLHGQDLVISIPVKNFKLNLNVDILEDLYWLLETLSYWMIQEMPETLIAYVLYHGSAQCNTICSSYELQFPELRLLQSLQNVPVTTWIPMAAQFGAIQMLKYLKENGYDITLHSAHIAAGVGELECLQYTVKEGNIQLDAATSLQAAASGNVACLKFVHEHGGGWHDQVCETAARSGYLDCLKYAYEHGAPWTVSTTNTAACYGRLSCTPPRMSQYQRSLQQGGAMGPFGVFKVSIPTWACGRQAVCERSTSE